FISSGWLNLNHNDAFSSMRRNSHRHFVRMRLCGDELTLFPVGLDDIPKRDHWRENTSELGSPPPYFVPDELLEPHLIEPPITIRAKRPPAARPTPLNRKRARRRQAQ